MQPDIAHEIASRQVRTGDMNDLVVFQNVLSIAESQSGSMPVSARRHLRPVFSLVVEIEKTGVGGEPCNLVIDQNITQNAPLTLAFQS